MRHSKLRSVVIAVLSISMMGFGLLAAEATESTRVTTPKVVRKLLWSQEFNSVKGKQVDFKYWRYDQGDGTANGIPGWGNNEQQYYQPSAIRTDGKGSMVITATRHPVETPENPSGEPTEENPTFCTLTYKACPWTSGRVNTSGKVGFKYGRMEARIKMPVGDGTWPAFWMLGANINKVGWPASGEIDIIEGSGGDPFVVSSALHGPNYSGGSALTRKILSSKSLSSVFHTYAIEWSPNKIQWLFDGKVFWTITANSVKPSPFPFNQEFYLVMNLAIGGWFVGNIVDPDLQSAKMNIDWIRYYSVNGVGKVIKH
jgi:beta-glucanase (GH16 family)